MESEWNFLGCVSMEDRCTGVIRNLPNHLSFSTKLALIVDDPISSYTAEINRKTYINEQIFLDCGFNLGDITRLNCQNSFGSVELRLNEFFNNVTGRNLIVDITSLPKKVFFFIVRLLSSNNFGFQNIVFTYAKPEKYANEPLAENPEPWDALPGFRLSSRMPPSEKYVIGVGFEPLGLPSVADAGEFQCKPVSFLFPFPSQVDRISKNWKFIRSIFPNEKQIEVKSVDATNIPEIFDKLVGISNNRRIPIALAPFGPKPMSLAMALFASSTLKTDCPAAVYYTQPTKYRPDYSTGLKLVNGTPDIDAYCIMINGSFCYS